MTAASSSEGIKLYSPAYYGVCAVGGILSCGLTHTMVVPLDIVKCRMQANKNLYSGVINGFRTMVAKEGAASLTLGWAPTLVGYSMQGACKFGFYELFKKTFSDAVGEESAEKYRTFVYLAASASAELIADVALCPFEAVKVRVQTTSGFAKGLGDGLPKILEAEGVAGLYKGLSPLWARQIPYTMMKFASFEKVVEAIYANVLSGKKDDYSKGAQLTVSFAGGYIAGVLCALVSQPADNMVSKLNSVKSTGSTMDAVKKIAAEMGIVGLFTTGLPARIIMVGTLTGLQWGIYDAFKVSVGLPTTGHVAKKEE